jgi:uncharacterized protein
MFRDMRRKKQQLSEAESLEILTGNTSGVLAVFGDDDYPYAVPISYVYHDGKIYFHMAKSGHKNDAIKRNNKISFCVIDQDKIVPQEVTTYFRSVIAFGKGRFVEDNETIINALTWLAEKYSPDYPEERQKAITGSADQACIMEMTIEHLTGKAAIEIIKSREG